MRSAIGIAIAAAWSACTFMVDTSTLSGTALVDGDSGQLADGPHGDSGQDGDASREDALESDVAAGDAGAVVEAGKDAAEGSDGAWRNVCADGGPALRLCYRFEDSLLDESGQNILPTLNDNLSFTAGRNGLAGRFTLFPTTDVRLASGDSRLLGVRTLEAWIYPLSSGREAQFVDVADDFAMGITSTGALYCTKPQLTAAFSIPLETWTHVACTLDGSMLRLYVDGQKVGEQASTNFCDNVNGMTTIGQRSPPPEQKFDGLIDDLRLWSTTLSPDEIAAVYRGER